MKTSKIVAFLTLAFGLFSSQFSEAQRLVVRYAPRPRPVVVVPGPRVVVVPGRPVVSAPVYVAPRRVYVAPRRVYVAPRPVVVVRRPVRRVIW